MYPGECGGLVVLLETKAIVGYRAFPLKPNESHSDRLVLDLYTEIAEADKEGAVLFGLPAVADNSLDTSIGQGQTVDRVRLGQANGKTRVVFDLSAPVEFDILPGVSPSEITLCLPGTLSRAELDNLPLSGTSVSRIRMNPDECGGLTILLETNEVVGYRAFLLPPYNSHGDRLVLDLYNEIAGAQTAGAVVIDAATAEAEQGSPPDDSFSNGLLGISGTWEHEWAVETGGVNNQKFESLVQPRLDADLGSRARLTAILRIRLDATGDLGPEEDRPENYSYINGPLFNSSHKELSLRELYIDTRWGDARWRIGKQQVVWGQADGIKVLDVVNPQSFREFILDRFDDSRIPLTMINVELPVAKDLTLQALWIPDPTYHELAEPGTPYFMTSPLLMPEAPEGIAIDIRSPDTPDDLVKDSDFGGRLSGFVGGWDVTLNYLYHYQDFPVPYQRVEMDGEVITGIVEPEYERNHLLGGTLSNAFGDLTLRAELAYNTDTFHVSNDYSRRGVENSAELASVIGLDWHLGSKDTLLSAQWFQSHLFDYRGSIRRDRTEHNFSVYYRRTFNNRIWAFDALTLYSLNHHDSMLQMKLKYLWSSNIEVWVGADVFSGTREGVFGQFRERDRILAGFEVGF